MLTQLRHRILSSAFIYRKLLTKPFSSLPDSDEQITAARQWFERFAKSSIPRHIAEISFSRSSGPGGQNVNKVNSKATIKVPLHALYPQVPRLLHPHLRSSRYAADKSQSLIIQSDESRKRNDNIEACFDKLHQLLSTAAKEAIPGETSKDQKDKVQRLKKSENEARIKSKKLHSSKKSSRRSSKYDD